LLSFQSWATTYCKSLFFYWLSQFEICVALFNNDLLLGLNFFITAYKFFEWIWCNGYLFSKNFHYIVASNLYDIVMNFISSSIRSVNFFCSSNSIKTLFKVWLYCFIILLIIIEKSKLLAFEKDALIKKGYCIFFIVIFLFEVKLYDRS